MVPLSFSRNNELHDGRSRAFRPNRIDGHGFSPHGNAVAQRWMTMLEDKLRSERLLEFFTEKGYQPILLPRSDLLPPEVYFLEERRYERHGSLRNFLIATDIIPQPTIANAVDLEKIYTNGRQAHLSFSFFKQLLDLLGLAGSLTASGKNNLAENSVLRFRDVKISSVPRLAVEQALSIGFHADQIGYDKIQQGIVHIAFEYMYAGRVEIAFGDQDALSIGLSSDLQVVGIEGGRSSETRGLDAATFESKTRAVAVAFKAGQLVRNGSNWELEVTRTSGSGFGPRSVVPYVYKPNEILAILDRTAPRE
jgi:hypothetical protein